MGHPKPIYGKAHRFVQLGVVMFNKSKQAKKMWTIFLTMSSLHNFSLLKFFTTFGTDMIWLHKAPICKTEPSLPLQALPSWKARWDNLPVVLTGAVLSRFSRVRLCVTLWTVAHQAPLSMVILQASTNLVSSLIVFLSLEPPPDNFWEFSSRQLLCHITPEVSCTCQNHISTFQRLKQFFQN